MLTRHSFRLTNTVLLSSRNLRWPHRPILANRTLSETRHQLGIRCFRPSPPRNHLFYALLASVLKTSATIELLKWTARAIFTVVPILWARALWFGKHLKKLEQRAKGNPELQKQNATLRETLRRHRRLCRILTSIPLVLVGLTVLGSLERTPLSGRWRVILLSPEEEDTISEQLQGEGWYKAIDEVISAGGATTIIPPSDRRYQVVESVLRELEDTIPSLAREKRAYELPWLDRGPDEAPLPPPATYPLRPRPAAKEYLRILADTCSRKMCLKDSSPLPGGEAPHLIAGPPYNLVVVDRSDCDNAFSFGFGPNGGGGIVVYSGFLDRVFAGRLHNQRQEAPPPRPLLAGLLGSILPTMGASSTPTSPVLSPCNPTKEERTQIAVLLAHELSHLILSHHLETLSAGTVFIPGTVSILSDFLRAMVFPITMFFGPFVNDALANIGKVGSGEFEKLSEYCTSVAQEFEADAVSARILAHAGYDARKAIDFWENRRAMKYSECTPQKGSQMEWELESSLLVTAPASEANGDTGIVSKMAGVGIRLAKRIVGATHPAHEARLLRLKSELQRWETERKRVLRKNRMKQMWKDRWATLMMAT